MSDPSKLREGDDFAARLLRAGSREHPARAARTRAERALGLSTLAAGVALTTTVQASAAGAAAGAAATSAPLALVTFAKWAAVGLLMGGAAAGGVTVLRDAVEPVRSRESEQVTAPAQPPSARPRANASPLRVAEPEPVEPATESNAVAEARPAVAQPAIVAAPREPTHGVIPAPSASAELALSREIELLERVRGQLRSGNSGGALLELEKVRGGIRALSTEAELLRIEALIAHGERPRAEALAAELQRRDPRWAQNFRLKRLLGAR